MPSNPSARLAKLEASLAAMHTQHTQQSDHELLAAAMARVALLSDEELLAQYEAAKNRPIDATTDPILAQKLAEIAAITDPSELIRLYMQSL